MNKNQLNYFVMAAETGSFTKAADYFYITQTAISLQIRLLEETVGAQLFDRSTRPVTLTTAGKVFLEEAKAILARMEHAEKLVRDVPEGIVGRLRIGYLSGYERSDLSAWVQHFHRENPNVLVTFFRATSEALASGLLSNDFDIVFTWDSTNLRQNTNIENRTVEKVPLVVAVYDKHPLAGCKSVQRSDLKGEKLIYMSSGASINSYGNSVYMERYRAAGYQPDILFSSTEAESVLMMVASEEGISVLSEYCTVKLYNPDNLTFIPLAGEEETEEIIVAWPKEQQNPAIARFLTYVTGK